ncbi:glucose-1-phosphate adenylyltransferase [Pedobacter changchengzhani]|uniref:Glucose-1-phosphate adenylyltransferase n=1 Tax=Pedobacter changchengzhani TaxID=2529274 RepID=A0A4R5MNB1_9SPHI|nr:glucose-1-phosphate adenylyltransferase [Pedobacter changchengzhani]TDG37036.1 glucose-1-phosphate adenylyltransferase [Pedobacter changchengzhani]
MTDKVLGVILGGGQGSRLSPLTQTRSKPAVPIAGKYRLVDIPISNCINSGIHRMFVLTQFNSASLNTHIKNTYHFSHFSKAFVDILAAEQTPDNPTWFQGTADAVRQCLPYIVAHETEYILILSGDQLYQMDFADMVKNHLDSGAEVTIATIPVTAKDATDFGILKTNDENVITSFTEKPKTGLEDWISDTGPVMQAEGREFLASMGIYLFNKQYLIDILSNNPTEKDFGKDILPRAINNSKVLSHQYEGYWTDIGTISSFFEANLGLTDEIPKFDLFDNAHAIFTRARMLPPSKISGTTLIKAVIAEGCIINANKIEHAVLGIRARIGKDTVIQNCYVMGSDRYQRLEEIEEETNAGKPLIGIGDRCFINNAILDKNCRIGNDVKINGGDHLADGDFELYAVKDGIVVVKKAAILPAGMEI